MFKIYHNTRCSKSRAGLQYLKEKLIDAKVVEYLKNPLTREELSKLLQKLGKSAFEMIRTQEELYKKQYKTKELSNDEWIDVLVENPKLLKRPIVEKGEKAVWAVPPEEIELLLNA